MSFGGFVTASKLIVRAAAEEDLEEASRWYERRERGLGKRFLAEVDATLAKLQDWPELGIVVHQQLRRGNVRRFPYGIFYQSVNDKIIVLGVLHNRRAPRQWKSRLE